MEMYVLDDGTYIQLPRDIPLLTTYARNKLYKIFNMDPHDCTVRQIVYEKALQKFGPIIKMPLHTADLLHVADDPPESYSSTPVAVFEINGYDGEYFYTLEFIRIEY